MRIVQAVGWYLPDSVGGTELYVSALAGELRRAGHELLVAAPRVGQGERRYQHDGVDIFRYPIPAAPTRAEARGDVPVRGADALHHWFQEVRPDVVHFHTFVTGLGLHEVEAARAAGAKVVVTSHAATLGFLCERGTLLHHGLTLCDGHVAATKCAVCALEQRQVPAPLAAMLGRVPAAIANVATSLNGKVGTALGMRSLIERNQLAQQRLFESTSAFVVLSDFAADVVRSNGAPPHKVIVNRLGVDVARGPWRIKPAAPTSFPVRVGYVGRAESIKGLDDVVRAVVSLPPSVPVELQVVAAAASPAERANVEACRAQAAGDARVSFLPPAAPHDIPQLLAGFDVLVCPSRAVEGGPTIALEAHAVGTPVIGAAMPALTEYVHDGVNGRLVAPGDWRALAAALQKIAFDPAGTIDTWRMALRQPRTFAEIARDYLALYTAA